jgi:hypothetical protein
MVKITAAAPGEIEVESPFLGGAYFAPKQPGHIPSELVHVLREYK